MKKITIAMADDHNLFRKGLISLLKGYKELKVVTEAINGKELLESIKQMQPQVVLLNIQMPVMNGIETLSLIKKKYPDIKVIILSGKIEEKLIFHSIEKGANCFLNKDIEIKTLVEAIYSVMEKGYYFNEMASKAMMKGVSYNKKNTLPASSSSLSNREVDVVKLICKQKTIKEIADTLCLSPRTIDTYRENIFQKTGAKNIVGVALYAIQHNLLDFQLQNA